MKHSKFPLIRSHLKDVKQKNHRFVFFFIQSVYVDFAPKMKILNSPKSSIGIPIYSQG